MAREVLEECDDPLEAVAATVSVLENSTLTNAGVGSNLSIDGTVECDAGIMDGTSLAFAGVGAISGVKNPVQVAKMMVDAQNNKAIQLGRKSPSLLVGAGVNRWMAEQGMSEIHPSQLITEESLQEYRKSLKKLSQADQQETTSFKGSLDTVGAICVGSHGNMASAVSSGGIILKHPGRVGHAACFGCGCWAQTYNMSTDEECSVAASTSGCGEDLMRVFLAKQCCDAIASMSDPLDAINAVFKEQFLDAFVNIFIIELKLASVSVILESPLLGDVSEKLGGAVVVKYERGNLELSLAHTTHSFIVAHQTTQQAKPKVSGIEFF
ncbi:Threonine aspartase 1 [Holothuria leucospilota]|uniref:Threonine aspartase 1 n=1 Tax=Holothuria leucospilota TaxID=206669 RepID=A0A9Q1BJX9_HOLLE|nr:Threonine aspartase 1 [Holothuria leucospilota]